MFFVVVVVVVVVFKNLFSSTRRRHFLLKALVYHCFLVFRRTGEYISLDWFYTECKITLLSDV